jgi:hypothetical protein
MGYGIHGFTDAIYYDEKNIFVVDHKTASSMRRWTYNKEPNVEMAMYLVLVEKAKHDRKMPDLPVAFEYHVVSAKEGKSRVIDCGYNTKELEDILLKALQEATAIEKYAAYRPKPEWNLCSPKYCAYFQGCRIDGTLTPYTLTTSNVPLHHTPIGE